MLQGAFTPPYCPALPAHIFGSISLWGGARSNCAHPQKVSRGNNIRSCSEPLCGSPSGGSEFCALTSIDISMGTARIHVNLFITPPEFMDCLKNWNCSDPRKILPGISASGFSQRHGAQHCNLQDTGAGSLAGPRAVNGPNLSPSIPGIHIRKTDLFHSWNRRFGKRCECNPRRLAGRLQ